MFISSMFSFVGSVLFSFSVCSETCLISEREARYHELTCRHVSPHAAEWRSLQLLVAACCILSTLRALSSLRSLARCARHTIIQHLRISVYLCVFGRVCMYLRVFARMCVYLLVFARICVYLRVFASICPHLHVFCASLRLCAPDSSFMPQTAVLEAKGLCW